MDEPPTPVPRNGGRVVMLVVPALFHSPTPPFSFQSILKQIKTPYHFTHKELLTEKDKDARTPRYITIPFSCLIKLYQELIPSVI